MSDSFDSSESLAQPASGAASASSLPVEIPLSALSDEAASAVLESYVLREGTDYGVEYTLEMKVSRLRKQIEAKKAHLIYDPTSETISFLTANEWRKWRQ